MASPSLRKPPSEQHFSELNGSCGKAVRNQTPLTEAGREGAFLTRPAAKAPDWAWATVSNASTQRAIGQRCVYSCELVCGNWGTEPCLHGVTSSLLDNPLFVCFRSPAPCKTGSLRSPTHWLLCPQLAFSAKSNVAGGSQAEMASPSQGRRAFRSTTGRTSMTLFRKSR